MTDCPNAEIRDLLPEFVHRTLSDGDAARVTAHLGSCAECQAEVALLRAVAATMRARPAVDVAAIVRALPAPPAAAPAGVPRLVLDGSDGPIVRETRVRAPRRAALRWGGAAAAIAAALAIAVIGRGRPSADAPRTPVVAVESDSAASAPPVVIARIDSAPVDTPVDTPAPRTPSVARAPETTRLAMSMEGGPGDLTDAELERLIGGLESFDGMPRVEPEESGPVGEGGEESE